MAYTVLIVDDSPMYRSLVQVFLSGLGLNFVEASSGKAALETLDRRPVDLIIADLSMPHMDGVEFIRILRRHPDKRLSAIPAVMLSGVTSEDRVYDALAAGANRFLLKPVCDADLVNTLRELLPGL